MGATRDLHSASSSRLQKSQSRNSTHPTPQADRVRDSVFCSLPFYGIISHLNEAFWVWAQAFYYFWFKDAAQKCTNKSMIWKHVNVFVWWSLSFQVVLPQPGSWVSNYYQWLAQCLVGSLLMSAQDEDFLFCLLMSAQERIATKTLSCFTQSFRILRIPRIYPCKKVAKCGKNG